MVMRVSSAHEEGGERLYSVNTERFVGDDAGNVRALLIHDVERVDGRFQKVEGSEWEDRKSTRLNSSHANISYAVFCLKKKKKTKTKDRSEELKMYSMYDRTCIIPTTPQPLFLTAFKKGTSQSSES